MEGTTQFKVSNTLEQLLCFLKGPIFDGDLISKSARDNLESSGLIIRVNGYQTITERGCKYLIDLGYLNQ